MDALSWMEPDSSFPSSLRILSAPIFDFRSQLQQENAHDHELQRLHQELSSNRSAFPDFTVVDGLLFHHRELYIEPYSPLKHLLLAEHHSVPTTCHHGITKTLACLIASFSWPRMRKDVKEFVLSCLECQQTKYLTKALAFTSTYPSTISCKRRISLLISLLAYHPLLVIQLFWSLWTVSQKLLILVCFIPMLLLIIQLNSLPLCIIDIMAFLKALYLIEAPFSLVGFRMNFFVYMGSSYI